MKNSFYIISFLICLVIINSCRPYTHPLINEMSCECGYMPMRNTESITDSIIPFAKVEITDSSLCMILDTAINLYQQYSFKKGHSQIWFNIIEEHDKDTTSVLIISVPYEGTLLNKYSNQKKYGAFFYKDYLFTWDKKDFYPTCPTSDYFKVTTDSISVQYYYPNAKVYSCRTKYLEMYKGVLIMSQFIDGTLSQLNKEIFCEKCKDDD